MTTGEWRNDAADRLHEALHALGPQIPNLDVGDCHCNLLTQVALDALSPNLAEAGNWEYFAGLAFAYHDAPEGTDNVAVAWSELHEAIHHWRTQGGREPRDPDELATGWVRP